jgi:phosphonate transport system substrate-binding protein
VASILSPKESYPLYSRFSAYLSERLDRPVELVQRYGYAEINELIAAGEVDLAVLCTGGYCDMTRRGGGSPLLVPVVQGGITYSSLLVVRAGSLIRSYGGTRGRVFVFTEPLSLTGFVYPWDRLRALGGARAYLGSYFFSRSHDRSLKAVLHDLADAAAVDSRVWAYFITAHPEVVRGLEVVERSEPFPVAPLVVPTSMPAAVREPLKRALMEMAGDSQGSLILAGLGIDRFQEPPAGIYAETLELFRRVEMETRGEP